MWIRPARRCMRSRVAAAARGFYLADWAMSSVAAVATLPEWWSVRRVSLPTSARGASAAVVTSTGDAASCSRWRPGLPPATATAGPRSRPSPTPAGSARRACTTTSARRRRWRRTSCGDPRMDWDSTWVDPATDPLIQLAQLLDLSLAELPNYLLALRLADEIAGGTSDRRSARPHLPRGREPCSAGWWPRRHRGCRAEPRASRPRRALGDGRLGGRRTRPRAGSGRARARGRGPAGGARASPRRGAALRRDDAPPEQKA